MIKKIHIEALKSMKNITVECSKLNLLVGVNSSGKSTFLQALLLMVQNRINKVGLNGKLVSLGEFREVRNYYMANHPIRIELWDDEFENPAWIEFDEGSEENSCSVSSSDDVDVLDLLESYDSKIDTPNLPSPETGFHYLSCHRVGVNDIYNKNMDDESNFGIDGEYALAYLLKNENKPVQDELTIKDSNVTNSLLDQVNYWLQYIVGTTIIVTDLKKTNYLQVKYNNNPSNASSEALYCRPINVGSGISYLISIIITCLGTDEDDIVIIENPEIHLHPKAQSKLCEFLYYISQAGRQLFVETHSDHIFNGLRVGVCTGKVRQEDIKINFFAINRQFETQCNPILFEEYGKIVGKNEEMDINDLFDQFELDLDKMLGL